MSSTVFHNCTVVINSTGNVTVTQKELYSQQPTVFYPIVPKSTPFFPALYIPSGINSNPFYGAIRSGFMGGSERRFTNA
jgi:hypothetical protein